jgi:hypothetical protein
LDLSRDTGGGTFDVHAAELSEPHSKAASVAEVA